MTLLDGKVAIVTGAGHGIGRAHALELAKHGAQVVVNDLGTSVTGDGADQKAADQTVELITSRGGAAVANYDDVADYDGAGRLVQQAVDTYGRLDVLVNNAGGAPYADAATVSPRFHAGVVGLNLLAPLALSQAANAVMQRQPDGGAIVMVSSVSGLRPSPGTAAYGAAKAGLHSLAESLAVEWAPKVRVNAVAPSAVLTEQAALHLGDEAAVARVAGTVPLGRLASPDDVGDACVFLASPLAAYVSGAVLVLHGGGERPAFLAAASVNHGTDTAEV
jgi:NAD(P)-dependent dehydrogenase (short-subunit alcohol dehydrogenase family)